MALLHEGMLNYLNVGNSLPFHNSWKVPSWWWTDTSYYNSRGERHRAAVRAGPQDRGSPAEGCAAPFQLPTDHSFLLHLHSPSEDSPASFQMVEVWNSAIKFPLSKATISSKHLQKNGSHDFPHLQPANKWLGEKTRRCYRHDRLHIQEACFTHQQQEFPMYLHYFKKQKSVVRASVTSTLREV